MGNFKVKLVGYFVLLALVPLAAAFWGFSSIAARSQTREADARLASSLRAATAIYDHQVEAAGERAQALAGKPGFAAALARHDRSRLEEYLGGRSGLTIEGRGGFRVGSPPPARAAERAVSVISPQGILGSVIGSVPLDDRLVATLEERAGLEESDTLALVSGGRVLAPRAGSIGAERGGTADATINGVRYRALLTSLGGAGEIELAVLTPQARIDQTSHSTQRRLLLALLGVLVLVGIVAWLEGRSIVRSVGRLVRASNAIAAGDLERRVPVSGRDELATLARSFNEMAEQLSARLRELEAERARLQEAITLFGEALAATHDIEQLLRVVLDAEIEATGACGGKVIVDGNVAAQVGKTEAPDRIEVPLRAGDTNFGSIVLFGDAFDEERTLTAVSLAGHAVVALENARLHRIVEHQALIDGLTGLANRRHAQAALESELARAERFGGPVSLVLCDLDNFKTVNDRFGHLAGDDVLRELAAVLRESVRSVDVAARWGGEEFALLLPATDGIGAAQVAERARAALERRTIISQDGQPIHVTASFGVASFPEYGSGEELLLAADAALYEAKRHGKNRVQAAPAAAARP